MSASFSYQAAFSRNIGWLSLHEQSQLRTKRVAIAGLGGVGGAHLLTLTRLGIGKFHIADLDSFELANFNRQAGATMKNVGRPKVDVLSEMCRDINPESEVAGFGEGVNDENLQAFFRGVDLYVDGLDFFAFQARERVFAYCAQRGIPAVTVAPLGMSAALLNFLPGKMDFEGYFGLAGLPEPEKAVRFLVGLAPAVLHRHYLVDKTQVDLKARKGPSTAMACQLCAGIAAIESLKILLGRGSARPAPHGMQFDGYRNRLAHTWRPGGNRNPLNRLAIAIARAQLGI